MGRIQPGQTHDPQTHQGQTPPAPVQYPPPQPIIHAPPPPHYSHHQPLNTNLQPPVANYFNNQYKSNVPTSQYGGVPVQAHFASPLTPQQGGSYGGYNNGGALMIQNSPMVMPQGRPLPASQGFKMPKIFQGGGGFVGTNPWMTGLFDCMQDPSNAFITALFPCVTFGQIADVLDNGHTNCVTSGIIFAFSPCLMSRPYRTKLRRMFGLVEGPASDWIVHFMFEPCALCQEYRELSKRGIDPALGYHGNRERLLNQQGLASSSTMAPPTTQTMT